MNWVRTNKFLAGFIAFMAVGVGVMGYLLYATQSRYSQTSQEYDSQVKELKRLEALKPYPEEANLKRFDEVRKAYGESVNSLQASMAGLSPAVEKAMSPTDFQNRLRDLVSEVLKSATTNGVALPDGFYLGFEQYRQTLPDATVTPLLSQQLTQVEQIVRILINRKVDKLNSVKRAALPGESGVLATPLPGAAAEKPKATGAELIVRRVIEIGYTANPSAFRETLGQIVEAPRLFVIRALQVKNEVDKGPVRGLDASIPGGGAAGRPGPAPVGAPGDQPLPEKGPPPLRYVVGQEKLDIVMNIELVHVQAPR